MKVNKQDYKRKGIYIIVNTTNQKKYVGKSINIGSRISNHISNLNAKSKDENRHLINAWHKYGKDAFIYFVVEYADDTEILSERELYWMAHFRTLDRKFGYNLRKDSSSNMVVHDETRKLLSKIGKEKYKNNPELRKKVGKKSSSFWKNNPKTKKQMAVAVSKSKTRYKIIQYTKDFEIINEFDSQKILKEKLPNYYLPAILNVCNGNKSSYKGYYWRYFDIENSKLLEVRRPIGIRQLQATCSLTHKIYIFNSVVEAAKQLNIPKSAIYEMAKGKNMPKHKFTFAWI